MPLKLRIHTVYTVSYMCTHIQSKTAQSIFVNMNYCLPKPETRVQVADQIMWWEMILLITNVKIFEVNYCMLSKQAGHYSLSARFVMLAEWMAGPLMDSPETRVTFRSKNHFQSETYSLLSYGMPLDIWWAPLFKAPLYLKCIAYIWSLLG